jgi:hypothetical protein
MLLFFPECEQQWISAGISHADNVITPRVIWRVAIHSGRQECGGSSTIEHLESDAHLVRGIELPAFSWQDRWHLKVHLQEIFDPLIKNTLLVH